MGVERALPGRTSQGFQPTIAKCQLAAGEAGGEWQQAGHGVASALGIGQAVAQHHVATAFAIDEAPGGAQPVKETAIGGKPPGVQFRIAARQEDGIGLRVWRLIGQRREERQAGSRPLPAIQQVRIGKGKGPVAGDGDGLAERWQ